MSRRDGGHDEGGRTYIAIDLKSFYASAECVARKLDPLSTNLVVADKSRTSKTICLAVSPSLKAYGLPGRARLFEVEQKMKEVNAARRFRAPDHRLVGSSCDADELAADPRLAADLVIAKPRMAHYLQVSGRIYGIYLKYAAADDIHVYSIDEVFMDVTHYLKSYGMTAHALARTIVRDICDETGITATAGIGTNLYLCKVAMDIVAKHIPADADGVRIAELDEMSYRRLLWAHRPLTDFWRIGRGYANKLEAHGLDTMGDIARCSLGRASDYYNEDLLYRLFGVNAELLIDHAWGWEPCTIADIKAYRPADNSISSGQVLQQPYDFGHARLVTREMTDALALELAGKGMTADHIALAVGYDAGNLKTSGGRGGIGPAPASAAVSDAVPSGMQIKADRYGRKVPKPAQGSAALSRRTDSPSVIGKAMTALFDRIVDPSLMVRRITVVFGNLMPVSDLVPDPVPDKARIPADAGKETADGRTDGGTGAGAAGGRMHAGMDYEQPDLFADPEQEDRRKVEDAQRDRRERDMQRTLLQVKRKFGRSAVLKGMNLEKGATGRQRNQQIGGHAA